MIIEEENYLAHYGILRKSGRYPWGSGGTQNERNKSFLDHVDALKQKGLSEAEIARAFGITTTQLRAAKSIVKSQQRQADISMAQRLRDKGLSNVAIGERMGINESSVRSLLAPGQKDKVDLLQTTASMLKEQVAKKGYIDIGVGVENHIGVSGTKLKTAVALLKEQGYTVHYIPIEQLGTGKTTTMMVLAAPKTPYSEVYRNRENIKQVTDFSNDGGRSYLGIKEPLSVSSKRVKVNYAEDGGKDADGVIYVRPGVPDVSLGGAHYAQVRVAVDGSHFIKGMAMYKDDLPAGVDLVFNTNKSSTGNKLDALKLMKDDPDNPFGSTVRQLVDKAGNVTSAMNIVYSEGDWEKWSKSLSSQFLSKQSPTLAKTQLNMTFEQRKSGFEEIKSLTNPAVRRHLLEKFSEETDSAAVHLKAAALPRQASHVILPIKTMKETEIYAPNFRNGERVVLIRHPHGGVFEIPELTVNNNHPEAKKLLGRTPDAVGIHSKVAERLSGADFDGDTVLVIPNSTGKIKTAPALSGLKNFDPQMYKLPADSPIPRITARTKQIEMGNISNLITDMTIQGAPHSEIAQAVRHSMVVIDAEKHELNYRQSAIDNGISNLKAKYQGSARSGAATLISRATSETRVAERKQGFTIDPVTGRKIHTETGASYVDRNGRTIVKTTRSQKLAETHDAFTLVSKNGGTPMEKVYAEHSNSLKELANQARLEAIRTMPMRYSPSAKTAYAHEVASLNAKLNLALKNRPLERQAQLVANTWVAAKRNANPNMDAAEVKKLKAQSLNEARTRTGAGKQLIEVSPDEWNAIQAGAISHSKLVDILNNSNLEQIKKLATPQPKTLMTPTKQGRAQAMLNSGYTQAEVADALGVSLSTLKRSLGGE